MTPIQARALNRARKEYCKAKCEMRSAFLRQTTYRGVPTVGPEKAAAERHGEFVYRGIPYCK